MREPARRCLACVIGYGVAGRLHHRVLTDLGWLVQVVAPESPRFRSITHIPCTPKVDLWVICTPTRIHLDSLRTVLTRDPEALVILEKPACSAGQIDALRTLMAKFPAARLRIVSQYNQSHALTVLADAMRRRPGEQHRRIEVAFTKDRRPDIARGRFVDREHGVFGYEWLHMIAVLNRLLPEATFADYLHAPRERTKLTSALDPELFITAAAEQVVAADCEIELFSTVVGRAAESEVPTPRWLRSLPQAPSGRQRVVRVFTDTCIYSLHLEPVVLPAGEILPRNIHLLTTITPTGEHAWVVSDSPMHNAVAEAIRALFDRSIPAEFDLRPLRRIGQLALATGAAREDAHEPTPILRCGVTPRPATARQIIRRSRSSGDHMSTICFLVSEDEMDRPFLQLPLDALNAGAQLLASGHRVTVWDRRLSDSPSAETADTGTVDIAVVITAIADRAQCYPLDLSPVRRAVSEVRRRWPGATVVACGPHGTQLPAATRADLGVDVVARGETDAAALGAVTDIVRSRQGPVLPTKGAYPPAALADWPLPAYGLVDLFDYEAEVIVEGRVRRGPCGITLAARGCTYGCSFCHLPFGTRLRTQPIDRVLADIVTLRERGVDFTFFLDYVFGLNPAFYGQLCDELGHTGIQWTGQTRAEVVLKSNVKLWAKAGCRAIWLGAESPGVAETSVGKRVAPDMVARAINALMNVGITPFTFVLLGLPDDPACLTGELVDWASTLPGYFGLNKMFLRPGTSLYDQVAPGLNGGTAPTTWTEVAAVTERYWAEYPVDLEAQWLQLTRLPNFLGNAMAAV